MEISLDALYKSLKAYDTELLSHFNDSNVSDRDYFSYAISEDIIQNTIGILIDRTFGIDDIVGMASNCRAIIEAITYWGIMDDGTLKDENFSRFRNQYKLIEYFAGKEILASASYPEDKTFVEDRIRDAESIISDYSKTLHIDEKKIRRICRSNLFVVYDEIPNKALSDTWFIQKYFPLDGYDETAKDAFFATYKILGFIVHPQFLMHDGMIEIMRKEVVGMSDVAIKVAYDWLKKEGKLKGDLGNEKALQEEANEQRMKGNFADISNKHSILKDFSDKTTIFPNGNDVYSRWFNQAFSSLYISADICGHLGYSELVISKTKSIIEYMAFNTYLNSIKDQSEFVARKQAFLYSSEIQILDFLTDKPNGAAEMKKLLQSTAKSAYERWYKKNYCLSSLEGFIGSLAKKGYWISNEGNNTYSSVVKTFLDNYKFSQDKRKIQMIDFFYHASMGAEHAGGYCFDMSEGVFNSAFKTIIPFVNRYLILHMSLVLETLKDHGASVIEAEKDFSTFLHLSLRENTLLQPNATDSK